MRKEFTPLKEDPRQGRKRKSRVAKTGKGPRLGGEVERCVLLGAEREGFMTDVRERGVRKDRGGNASTNLQTVDWVPFMGEEEMGRLEMGKRDGVFGFDQVKLARKKVAK